MLPQNDSVKKLRKLYPNLKSLSDPNTFFFDDLIKEGPQEEAEDSFIAWFTNDGQTGDASPFCPNCCKIL